MVKGVFTSLKSAMGTSLSELDPTVYVRGPHEDMRESDGCMRSCLSALRKLVGWPSYSPILNRVVPDETLPEMLAVLVCPALTLTLLDANLYSPWYSTWVYVPGFMAGDVKPPEESAYTQYCALPLYQWRTFCTPLAPPVAVPLTVPRPLGPTYPETPRLAKKVVSIVLPVGTPERENDRAYGPCRPMR